MYEKLIEVLGEESIDDGVRPVVLTKAPAIASSFQELYHQFVNASYAALNIEFNQEAAEMRSLSDTFNALGTYLALSQSDARFCPLEGRCFVLLSSPRL